jgi:hypothetical protein
VLPAPATIPARVLATLVAAENLGELHLALAPTAVWRPPTWRDPPADEYLAALGWRDRTSGLEREVAATLAVLCRPVVELYGWITHRGTTIGVLAGRIGKDAVLAVRTQDGMVGLSNIPTTRLADRLVAQTPPVPAAQVKPFLVSPAEVRSVTWSGRLLSPAGVTARRASPETRLAKQLLVQPRTGGAELWAATRTSTGLRHAIEHPVRYADVGGRRWLITTVSPTQVALGPGGPEHLVAVLNRGLGTLITSSSGP